MDIYTYMFIHMCTNIAREDAAEKDQILAQHTQGLFTYGKGCLHMVRFVYIWFTYGNI